MSRGAQGIPATLLNASADGLACLASSRMRSSLTSGSRIVAEFSIGDTAKVFTLPAKIVYVEPAARDDSVRVGIEFEADAGCGRSELAAALASEHDEHKHGHAEPAARRHPG